MNSWRKSVVIWCLCPGLAQIATAQITNTSISIADSFVCTGSTNYQNGADLTGINFGAAGTLVVAPAGGAKGEFQSVIEFGLAAGVDLFNTAYGSNNWSISGISLEFTSNDGTAGEQPNNALFPMITGGKFVIEWLSTNGWPEGTGTPNLPTMDGITFNSVSNLLFGAREILSTNLYLPPGDNVPVVYDLPLSTNVLAEIYSGSDVTFRLYAADGQIGYLFNSDKFGHGNEPKIHVIATPGLKFLSAVCSNGIFAVSAIGNNFSTYNVQVSTNLLPAGWMTIGTATADGSGRIQFDDPATVTQAQRFYRLSQ